MQTRPYDTKDGKRCWISRDERQQLLDAVDTDLQRRIALQLGLHGLRTDEIVEVAAGSLWTAGDVQMLHLDDTKTDSERDVPIDTELSRSIESLHNGPNDIGKHDPVVNTSKRNLRNWIEAARENVDVEHRQLITMHDLRRTWATDTFYSLAFEGVPIAEELTMSWGGWEHTATGRETFRQNYLGPVPEHITEQAMELILE